MRFFLLCRIIRQNDCNPDRLRGVLHILYLLQYLKVHVSFNNLTHLVWLYCGIANNCILKDYDPAIRKLLQDDLQDVVNIDDHIK